MVPVSWHDTVRVDTGDGRGLLLEVTGRAQGVPVEMEKNLAGRAALKLAAAAGLKEPAAKITLHKVLPPGGGIGGGSSDAAGVLVALNQAWGLHWPQERLEKVAAELGSDVPFFVEMRPKLCTGRGEIMTPLAPAKRLFAVLLIPPLGCPTKEVYEAFDAGHQHKPAPEKTDWPSLAAGNAEEIAQRLVNDLEPAAFAIAPWLRDLRDRAEKAAGKRVHMTGSGSTLFILCGSGAETGDLAEKLTGALAGACGCVPVSVLG